jgi:hypothetical protein
MPLLSRKSQLIIFLFQLMLIYGNKTLFFCPWLLAAPSKNFFLFASSWRRYQRAFFCSPAAGDTIKDLFFVPQVLICQIRGFRCIPTRFDAQKKEIKRPNRLQRTCRKENPMRKWLQVNVGNGEIGGTGFPGTKGAVRARPGC